MPLNPTQSAKLLEIKAAFLEVDIARNRMDQLLIKIEQVGNDLDINLTSDQINNLILKYTDLRDILIEKVNLLPTIG